MDTPKPAVLIEKYLKLGDFDHAYYLLQKKRDFLSDQDYKKYVSQFPNVEKYYFAIAKQTRNKKRVENDEKIAQKLKLKQLKNKQKQQQKQIEIRRKWTFLKNQAEEEIEKFFKQRKTAYAKKSYEKYQENEPPKAFLLPEFKFYEEKHKKYLKKLNQDCKNQINNLDLALNELKKQVLAKNFLSQEKITKIQAANFAEKSIPDLEYSDYFEEYVEKKAKLDDILCKFIPEYNQKIIRHARRLIGTIRGKNLDEQQIECICKKDHNQLVVAGAGTGKTTTIVGKVKYLIKSKQFEPQEILALSFTDASTCELKKRIKNEVNPCNIMTFHKLGLEILRKTTKKSYRVADETILSKIIKAGIDKQDNQFHRDLIYYVEKYNVRPESEFNFSSQTEYDDYLKLNPPITLRGENVKSYGELAIANFLTKMGIKYRYEYPYKIDTSDQNHRRYCPDFYLPDFDVYIEYFALDRAGNAPAYFDSDYVKSVKWKRLTHQKYTTTMIECFAYEMLDDSLLENLTRNLKKHSINVKEISIDVLWKNISGKKDSVVTTIQKRLAATINHMKSCNCDLVNLKSKNAFEKDKFKHKHNQLFLKLLAPIYELYESTLKQHELIDFNDMINLAADAVMDGKYQNPYRCIIIDEYQDISTARYRLLKALRDSSDFTLFCVGDDWQSIYRFSGSNINLFTNFEKFWGETEISKIETTYRFPQEIADKSGEFIMKNPRQIKKSLKSVRDNIPGEAALEEIPLYSKKYLLPFLAKRLDRFPPGSTILLLGRYNQDKDIFKDDEEGLFECRFDNQSKSLMLKYKSNPKLRITFLTIHRAKGLEADYVFVLNNKNGIKGFPSKVLDNPLMQILNEDPDWYPYEEERRLFYVAITRARRQAYLFAYAQPADWQGRIIKPSCFIEELREDGLI